jgi:dTMP kinase
MDRGRFITFEGIEGSGKSTQIRLLREHLTKGGHSVRLLREPGGTPIGDRIRAILLDASLPELTDTTEMFLFAASRAQLIREEVRPALAAGETVLCDRFVYSSLAYQAHARGLGREQVWTVNAPAIEGLLPDRVVLLDLPPATALGRAQARGTLDRIEAESLGFHEAVRAGFLAEASADPERFRVIEATGTPEDIHERVLEGLGGLL